MANSAEQNPIENPGESLEKFKELLLSGYHESLAARDLFREILIRDLYEKLDNDSLLVEAAIMRKNVKRFLAELKKIKYASGTDASIDTLQSLVKELIESADLEWKSVCEKYPNLKKEMIADLPNINPDDLSKN